MISVSHIMVPFRSIEQLIFDSFRCSGAAASGLGLADVAASLDLCARQRSVASHATKQPKTYRTGTNGGENYLMTYMQCPPFALFSLLSAPPVITSVVYVTFGGMGWLSGFSHILSGLRLGWR